MTINDFKSIEGDRQVGIRTLPVVFGETNAALIAALYFSSTPKRSRNDALVRNSLLT